MKKLIVLVAMLALMLALAVPAWARVSNENSACNAKEITKINDFIDQSDPNDGHGYLGQFYFNVPGDEPVLENRGAGDAFGIGRDGTRYCSDYYP